MKFLIVVAVAFVAGSDAFDLSGAGGVPDPTKVAACATPAADYKIVNKDLGQLYNRLTSGHICNSTTPVDEPTAQVFTLLGTLIKIIDCLILALGKALDAVIAVVVDILNTVINLLCSLLGGGGGSDINTNIVTAIQNAITCVLKDPTDLPNCLSDLQTALTKLSGGLPGKK